jgi:hypothetical protein
MTEFHKIWIEQCEAAEGIRERFGVRDAVRYLVGEKLLHFMQASHQHPEFAQELPLFAASIKRIFTADELQVFFDDLQSGRIPDPAKLMSGDEFAERELDEFETVNEADQILVIENAKRLLFE